MQIDVSVLDPWMLILTPIPLVLAALCASYLSAARRGWIPRSRFARTDGDPFVP